MTVLIQQTPGDSARSLSRRTLPSHPSRDRTPGRNRRRRADPIVGRLHDEHCVLLWQTCAYAENVVDEVRARYPPVNALSELLGFLHGRLLPYLNREAELFANVRLRTDWVARALLADHARIRADIECITASRTRSQTRQAVDALVGNLDRHLQHQQVWFADPAVHHIAGFDDELPGWALPLLLGKDIDVDCLPATGGEALVIQRLQQMRRGEVLRLHAGHDLQGLWRLLYARTRGDHGWVYEKGGPVEWTARITKRGSSS
jgi:uncharacterized protein (DUF2249 family)